MGSYQYEAINKVGDIVSGKLEADEQSSVVARLRSMGLMAMEIKEVKQSSLFGGLSIASKVKLGDLSLFSRQLAAMLNSGIPLTRSLHTLSKQVSNQTLSKALLEIARSVESGASFSEALKGYPFLFDSLYISMVSAGEAGGSLEQALNRLSNQLQKAKELRDNIKSATFYPIIVLVFALMILFGMLFFLVPIFIGFFPADAVLPLPTRIIVGLSDLVKNYWYILFPGMILLFLSLSSYARSTKGKRRIDRLTYRFPVIGPLIQKTAVASFSRTFSGLVATGIPVVQALDASGKASGHTLIMDAAQMAGERIHEGSGIAEPLDASGVFPPMVIHMIAVGEETGDIPDMMDKVASFFEEEVATTTKGLTSLIEPLMLIVVGILVGGMLIALYLPIFTVITQI